ncbi:hypothetical protein QE406_000162 [Microbacterium testaceum]|nr:hypothetical protein [Microbacterium testaceum]
MTEPTTLDVDALRARPSRSELRRFWARFRREYPRVRDPERRGRRAVFTFLLIVSTIGALGSWATITSEIRHGGSDEVRPMALFAFMFLGVFVFSVWGVIRTAKGRTRPREHWALAHFAEDNGLIYTPGPRSGTMRAWWSITGHTVSRAMTRENADGRTVEWADYEIRNATRRFTYPPVGGWIRIGLRRPLPHIIVRAARRGTRAFAVAAVPDSAQRLSLEGDFDEHFDLYCPEGYEADALYLFTPPMSWPRRSMTRADGTSRSSTICSFSCTRAMSSRPTRSGGSRSCAPRTPSPRSSSSGSAGARASSETTPR